MAGLLEGMKTNLMSIDELRDVVEPSGLFTDAQLAEAYKNAAQNHRFTLSHRMPSFDDRVAHGKIVWHLAMRQSWNQEGELTHEVQVKVGPRSGMKYPTRVSAEGVRIWFFHHRRCLLCYVAPAATSVSVPGELCVPLPRPAPSFFSRVRATIIVHVPATAFK